MATILETFLSIVGKDPNSLTDYAKNYEITKKAVIDGITNFLDTNGLIKTSSTLNAESVSVHVGDVDLTGASASNLTSVANAQGTSGTGIIQPTGGSGILGWLSGIFNKLSNPLAVTGTFWQATQPVSGTVTEANSTAILTAANKPQYDASSNQIVNPLPSIAGIDSVSAYGNGNVITAAIASLPSSSTYTANNIVSSGTTTAYQITAATNASPIVITCASHPFTTGQGLTIAGVVGNTNTNGNWIITKIDANTFSLNGSSGNAAWTSGGYIIPMLYFPDSARIVGQQGLIQSAVCLDGANQATLPQLKLWLFKKPVTMSINNTALALTSTDILNLVGYIDFTSFQITNTASGASGNSVCSLTNTGLYFACDAASKDLHGLVTSDNGYTWTTGETINFSLKITART